MSEQIKDFKAAIISIVALSIIIFAFLVWLIYFKETPEQTLAWTKNLPLVNSILNSLTAILLVLGYKAIRSGDKEKHKLLMVSATATSAFFLVGYVIYHNYHGDTKFIAEGFIRYIYFFILISHILLSIIQVPMILLTHFFAWTNKTVHHKKVAKITFPIWLYVSVTGVLIYLFLKFLNN